MARVIDAGSYAATMAEVHVDATSGKITVLRIVCAQDLGVVVHPEGAAMQTEGGLTRGPRDTLGEEVQFRDGEILDRNFDTLDIPRLGSDPRVQVVPVRADDVAPQGCGEPAVTTTGAVIANAVFDATGVRIDRLPMLPQRVRQAIQAHASAASTLPRLAHFVRSAWPEASCGAVRARRPPGPRATP